MARTIIGMAAGTPGRNRTCDKPLRRRALYPLSYWGAVVRADSPVRRAGVYPIVVAFLDPADVPSPDISSLGPTIVYDRFDPQRRGDTGPPRDYRLGVSLPAPADGAFAARWRRNS